MSIQKPSINPDFPIIEELRLRWSGRAYDSKPIPPEVIGSLFEAARWAPSSFNEQPWRFLVCERGTPEWEKLASTLNSFNSWSKNAALLVFALAKNYLDHNNNPNSHAWHDTGLAIGSLLAQATREGLNVHQMGGFNAAQAMDLMEIPTGYDPISILAIGYRADSETLEETLYLREIAPQKRIPQSEFVFNRKWVNNK